MKRSINIPGPLPRPACCLVSLVMAALFALVFMGSNSPLGPAIGSDNAIYLTMGTALKNGFAPYTQVFDHKGPMLFLLETLAQLFTSGYSTLGVFVMETLFLWGCLLLIGTIARRMDVSGVPAQLAFVLLLAPAIDGGNYCEEYSNLFNLAGMLLLLHVFDRDEKKITPKGCILPAALAGAALMLSFLVRANNMLPLGGMIAGAALWLLVRRRFDVFGACALGLLGGAAAAAVPVGAWLYAQGALSEAIYASIVHNVMYAGTEGRSRMQMLLADPYGWQALIMAALACAGALAYALAHRRPVVFVMAFFGAAMAGFAAFISHKFYSHYLMLGAPLAAVGAAMLLAAAKARGVRIPFAAAAAGALVCAGLFAGFGLRENGERAADHAVFEQLESDTQALLAHVPHQERDELLGYRTEPKWFVAAEAMPYMRYYFLQEILGQADPAVMDEIAEIFHTDPPKWLVIYYNRPFSPPYDARVQAVMNERYEFVDAKGQYQLLRLKEAS